MTFRSLLIRVFAAMPKSKIAFGQEKNPKKEGTFWQGESSPPSELAFLPLVSFFDT